MGGKERAVEVTITQAEKRWKTTVMVKDTQTYCTYIHTGRQTDRLTHTDALTDAHAQLMQGLTLWLTQGLDK